MSRRFSWLKLAYRECLGQYDPWPSKELIESNEVMRLGKHERAILKTLEIYHGGDMQWTWHESQGLGKLANADAIRDFKEGNIVPVWMLKRDIGCGKTVLSRSLKTLSEKGLIVLLGGDLDRPDMLLSSYAKYVCITGEGLGETARLQS